MLKLIGRRLLIAIPLLLVIASLTFVLINLVPGDPAVSILGPDATQEQYEALRSELGLDRPLAVQYLDWLVHALQGDLGESLQTRLPVTRTIAQSLPVTLLVAVFGVLATFLVGVALGLVSSLGGRFVGRTSQIVSILGVSVPNFWFGVLLVLVFAVNLGWLPATGYVPFADDPTQWARSLVLPVATVALGGVAAISRQTRAAMNEALAKDYVRTLLASGTPRSVIVLKHALRNASIPVVTSLGFQFIGIFGGAFIIEQVFALPGLGRLTISAIGTHDIPVVQGVVLTTAAMVIVVNLIVDVLYSLLNPKVRH